MDASAPADASMGQDDDTASIRTHGSTESSNASAGTAASSVWGGEWPDPNDAQDSDEDEDEDRDAPLRYSPDRQAFYEHVWDDSEAYDKTIFERLVQKGYIDTSYYSLKWNHPQHPWEPFSLCYNTCDFVDDEPKLLIHQSSTSPRPPELGVGHIEGPEMHALVLRMAPGSAVIYKDWCCHRLEALTRDTPERKAVQLANELGEIVTSCDGSCWTRADGADAAETKPSAQMSTEPEPPTLSRKPAVDWAGIAENGPWNVCMRTRLDEDLKGLSRWPQNAPPALVALEGDTRYVQCNGCRLELLLEVHKDEVVKRRADRAEGQRPP